MSTTSSVITIVICVVLIAAIGYALVKGIWSAARKITVPIQIALFVLMLVCVCRLFCTKENAQRLYDGIEQTGISQNLENTMRSALKLPSAETPRHQSNQGQVSVATAAPELVAAPAAKAKEPETPTANAEVKEAPAPQPVVEQTPASALAPVKAPDYSYLDKGKKSYTYALPFNAKATVGFKDNTYRVIVESLGSLDASEKKEVGKLILTSLGKYAGKTIKSWDKSKISIESRYDEADGHTHVFAVIPPDAID